MHISKLYIDSQIIDYPTTKYIRSKLKIPFKIIDNRYIFYKKMIKKNYSISDSKKILFLTYNKGNFIKKCPGTHYYTCCNYFIIHIGSFCNMDCSYCILQSYFRMPIMQFFVNYEKLNLELNKFFNENFISRIGTGEFTDSLIWEPVSKISKYLIKKFSKQNKSVLELKSKISNIHELKNLTHNKKTILSWSLNTPRIIKTEEKFTSSLVSRLKAASICEAWGYPLAFHLDPMFIYQGCKKEYQKVIELLFESVSPKSIVWISMGTFRFMTSIKSTIKNRFPHSKIINGKFINGLDNKMRYYKSMRIELYQHITKIIHEIAPDIFVYLCMEDNSTWHQSLDIYLKNSGDLNFRLNIQAAKKCYLTF